MLKLNRFWYAVAVMVASTVGIGLFGIPYTFAQAGFGVGIISLGVLTALVLVINLCYGEVVLRTHARHQFVGYVRKYLGPGARVLAYINFTIAVFGSFIGILIINGQFLSVILGALGWRVAPPVLSTVFVIIAIALVLRGLRTVSRVDFLVMAVAVGIIALIALWGLPQLVRGHYVFSTGSAWFLPFGVILFALNGVNGVPLVRESLIGREHSYRRTLLLGTLLPALLYAVFAAAVVGVSGPLTEGSAIPGLADPLGSGIVLVGSFFGFLTSSTIFLSIMTAFRESLIEDFKLRERRWFILFLLLPFLLFLAGVDDFIAVIGLVGGVAVSFDMILLLLLYARTKEDGDRIPEYALKIPNAIVYAMMVVFLLGAVYTLTV